MVRIEFVKGIGGVTNLINGRLRDTLKNTIQNIDNIDKVIVDSYDAMAINETLNVLEISGYIVFFESKQHMQVYLDQIFLLDGEIFNPGVNGIKKPAWDIGDKNKTQGIQPHTYVNTDIEKQLIGS